MSFKNFLPFDPKTADKVRETIQDLAGIANTQVTIETNLVVTTESLDFSMTLDSLKAAMNGGEAEKPKKKKARAPWGSKTRNGKRMGRPLGSGKKANDDSVKPRGRYVKSWELVDTGEKIHRGELDRRLADQSIAIGSIVRHPKHGSVTVRIGKSPSESFVLIDPFGTQL